MSNPPSTSVAFTREEALLIAAHLKIQARIMQNAADAATEGVPNMIPEMAQLLKKHCAMFEAIADRLYEPFLGTRLITHVDDASDQIATELRRL